MKDAKKLYPESYSAWASDKDDPAAKKDFLKSIDPVISASLRTHAGGMEKDLKTKAKVMALKAADRYDPSKGVQLNTFLMNDLKGLKRIARKRSQVVKVAEGRSLDAARILEASKEIGAEKSRPATVEELTDKTGISRKRLEMLRKSPSVMNESSLLTEEGDSLFTKTRDPQEIWSRYVYDELDPVDKKIYEWSTGYAGSHILKKGQIATKLGISAPAVSQRVNKIIRKLQDGEGLSV